MICYTKVLLRWTDQEIYQYCKMYTTLSSDKYAIRIVSDINKILTLRLEVKGFRETMSNLNTIQTVYVMVNYSGNVW
jgi:hypothetical protein